MSLKDKQFTQSKIAKANTEKEENEECEGESEEVLEREFSRVSIWPLKKQNQLNMALIETVCSIKNNSANFRKLKIILPFTY